jgi:hypothetical protein
LLNIAQCQRYFLLFQIWPSLEDKCTYHNLSCLQTRHLFLTIFSGSSSFFLLKMGSQVCSWNPVLVSKKATQCYERFMKDQKPPLILTGLGI